MTEAPSTEDHSCWDDGVQTISFYFIWFLESHKRGRDDVDITVPELHEIVAPVPLAITQPRVGPEQISHDGTADEFALKHFLLNFFNSVSKSI